MIALLISWSIFLKIDGIAVFNELSLEQLFFFLAKMFVLLISINF